MKKTLLLIGLLLIVAPVIARCSTNERISIPDVDVNKIVNDIGIDKVAHFAAGYALQDVTNRLLFTKKVEYKLDDGTVIVKKEGRKFGKTLSVLLNAGFWIAKEKYIDSSPDWKDAGASCIGISTWIIVKQF